MSMSISCVVQCGAVWCSVSQRVAVCCTVTWLAMCQGRHVNEHILPNDWAVGANVYKHNATHCITLQHTATYCNIHKRFSEVRHFSVGISCLAFGLLAVIWQTHCQHTATHTHTTGACEVGHASWYILPSVWAASSHVCSTPGAVYFRYYESGSFPTLFCFFYMGHFCMDDIHSHVCPGSLMLLAICHEWVFVTNMFVTNECLSRMRVWNLSCVTRLTHISSKPMLCSSTRSFLLHESGPFFFLSLLYGRHYSPMYDVTHACQHSCMRRQHSYVYEYI